MKRVKPYKVAKDAGEPKPARVRKPRKKKNAGASVVRPFVLTAVAMLGIAGMVVGVGALESRAGAYRQHARAAVVFDWPQRVDPSTGEVQHLIPESIRASIVEGAERALGPTIEPFSMAPLMRLGLHLEASGWFDGTPKVQRGAGAEFKVSGSWRAHAAVVRFRDADHLVSVDGYPMPVVYGPERRSATLKAIVNPRFGPPRSSTGGIDYTRAWEGADVKAALGLLALLRTEAFWGQIAAIDVDGFDGARTLTIITDRGTRIGWGGPVGEFAPGQTPEASRLAMLRFFFERQGVKHIDGGMESYDLWDRTMRIERGSSTGP